MIKNVPGIGRETSWNVSALEETFMKKERKIQFVLTLDNVIVNATYCTLRGAIIKKEYSLSKHRGDSPLS